MCGLETMRHARYIRHLSGHACWFCEVVVEGPFLWLISGEAVGVLELSVDGGVRLPWFPFCLSLEFSFRVTVNSR